MQRNRAKILCMTGPDHGEPPPTDPDVATIADADLIADGPPLPAYPVDAAALRTLAHPLRSRLLAELRSLGPATATDLAVSLGTNTGATSYHLRRLEEVGLVADTGAGRGRRRLWAAATDGREVAPGDDEDDDAAAEWLARDYVQHFAGKAQDWIGRAGEWSPTWQDVTGLDDRLVLVTDDQLAALRGEVDNVLARYRRVGAGNPQAKRVTFYTCAFPVDPPGRGTSGRPSRGGPTR
jgi:DNA-binding transcriptional ArsR family regulator